MHFLRTPLIVVIAASGIASVAYARRMRGWTYEDLTTKSDLVVIAIPITSESTEERIDLPGILMQAPDRTQKKITASSRKMVELAERAHRREAARRVAIRPRRAQREGSPLLRERGKGHEGIPVHLTRKCLITC